MTVPQIELPSKPTPRMTQLELLMIMIYGPPKVGKTTWCAGAPNALFAATEAGLAGQEVPQVPIHSWAELWGLYLSLRDKKHPYKTVVIDTADSAYRLCAEHLYKKKNIEHESDLEMGKGWALVRNEFTRLLMKFQQLPYGLILVSHSTTKPVRTRTGDIMKAVPNIPGQSKGVALDNVDILLYADVEDARSETGEPITRRVLHTQPTPQYEAGCRVCTLPDPLPLDYPAFLDAFNKAIKEGSKK